ncbi:MAG: hypothetical protein H9W81_13590 [Enterococcus sp.]|nr:hypothetical protein [Enterococcus sp.]
MNSTDKEWRKRELLFRQRILTACLHYDNCENRVGYRKHVQAYVDMLNIMDEMRGDYSSQDIVEAICGAATERQRKTDGDLSSSDSELLATAIAYKDVDDHLNTLMRSDISFDWGNKVSTLREALVQQATLHRSLAKTSDVFETAFTPVAEAYDNLSKEFDKTADTGVSERELVEHMSEFSDTLRRELGKNWTIEKTPQSREAMAQVVVDDYIQGVIYSAQ